MVEEIVVLVLVGAWLRIAVKLMRDEWRREHGTQDKEGE